MSIFAKRNATSEDIKKIFDEFDCGKYDVMTTPFIQKDVKEISFDIENIMDEDEIDPGELYYGLKLGYNTLDNGVVIKLVTCGGDWQFPVAVCIYMGEDNELHAYVPKNGNVYNREYNCAYGDHDDFYCNVDLVNNKEKFMYDMEALMKDASEHILLSDKI